jgi:hypothetical protein
MSWQHPADAVGNLVQQRARWSLTLLHNPCLHSLYLCGPEHYLTLYSLLVSSDKGLPLEPFPSWQGLDSLLACLHLKQPDPVLHVTPLVWLVSLSFPASFWLPYYTPSYIPCLYLCPFPSTIHSTLKMEAACSSKALASYHSTTQCHNPDKLDLYMWLFSYFTALY